MNQHAPPCRVAVTVTGAAGFKVTPDTLLSARSSGAVSDVPPRLADGPSGALDVSGVLADWPLVAAGAVSLAGAVRETVFFLKVIVLSSRA